MTEHALSIIEAMNAPTFFEPWFRGESWDAWRSVLRAAFALQMSKSDRQAFHILAGGRPLPTKPVKELWIVAGRRAGKDSIASLIATHAASFFDGRGKLRPGEKASVLCLATDKEQARIVLGYIKSFFSDVPFLAEMVKRERVDGLELSNNVEIVVSQSDYRAVRGRAVALAIFDELAFWRTDNAASPDDEVFSAIKPGTMTLGGMVIGISTPHKKAGLLYDRWKEFYGKDGDVLVIHAPSVSLNPLLDAGEINREIERDPAKGRAEWLALWRDDLATFIDRALIEAAVDTGVTVQSPIPNTRYFCFIDPSGGVGDSMTLAIAHREDDRVILDCMVEKAAPFVPQVVVADFAKIMREYGLTTCTSDRYAASWVTQAFAAVGVTVMHSARDRSAIYTDALPIFTSGRACLLDSKKLVSQFCALERKTTATRDKIDHPEHGGHDDVCNSAAGAMVLANDRATDVVVPGGAGQTWGVVSVPRHYPGEAGAAVKNDRAFAYANGCGSYRGGGSGPGNGSVCW
jgi:hypothetical protein